MKVLLHLGKTPLPTLCIMGKLDCSFLWDNEIPTVEILDTFRMKQTKMYDVLVEVILDDLHYLMYKLELRY